MATVNKFDDICGNFMKGACVLLNLVGHHLYVKKWAQSNITDSVLPPDTYIAYRHDAETIPREDATPLVTYSVGPTVLETHNPNTDVTGRRSTTARVFTEIKFKVSTNSIGLTSALAIEIGGLCIGAAKALKQFELHLTKAVVSDVKPQHDGFYMSEISMTCGLGYPVWNFEGLEDKLREIVIGLDDAYSTQS